MVFNRLTFLLSCLAFLFLHGAVQAQSDKYLVKFKDKNNTPYSADDPGKFVTKRAIDRRARYSIPFTFSDLPVNPSYVDQLRSLPKVNLRYVTKWFNGAVVSFSDGNDAAGLALINSLPFVENTSKVRRIRRSVVLPDSTKRVAGPAAVQRSTAFDYGQALNQAQQLDVTCLHERGYRGQGMVIAVMDAGFFSVPVTDVFDSLRNTGRILGGRDFVHGGTNPYVGGDHGTMVLSCMAALKPGTSIGTAPLASYWLLRTEEGGAETISEEYNWVRAAEFADSVGADILTTSLGYTDFDDPAQSHKYADLNGRTAPMSIASTMAARKGMVVLNAAGNEGDKSWYYISVAGDADSMITVGSVNSAGKKSTFSSHGPTSDGRIKPDFMAQGEGCWVCSGTVCFPGNGTSFAAPVLAGGVACYWQRNRRLNPIQVIEFMRKSASGRDSANNRYGWGLPQLCVSPFNAPTSMNFTAYAGENSIRVILPPANYDNLEISVTDMLGREMFRSVTDGTNFDVHLSMPGLSNGIYVVKITSPYGEKAIKVPKPGL